MIDYCRYCSTPYSVVLLEAVQGGWMVRCEVCRVEYLLSDREVTGG